MTDLWTRFLWLLPAEPVMLETSIPKKQPSDDFSCSILYRTAEQWAENPIIPKRTCYIRACKGVATTVEVVLKEGIIPTDDMELRVTDPDERDWVRMVVHAGSESEGEGAKEGVVRYDRYEVRRRIWTPDGKVMEPCWSFNYSHCARCGLGELYIDTQRVVTHPAFAGYAVRSELWVGTSEMVRAPRLSFSVEAAAVLDSHPAAAEFLSRPGFGRKEATT